jgi:hypothetical protein
MRTLVLLMIAAQALPPQPGRLPHRLPDILTLVDQARALPSEFRADTLLRLAESSLSTQARKQQLIEEAFWAGSHATLPYMERADGRSDSVATNAFRANRLEGLTLQSKAVQAMLPLDSRKALRLFEQISPLHLPRLNCSAISTPDVVDYYQTALLVFENSFSPQQRRAGDDVALLSQLVAGIESPGQVPPALEMLFAAKLTPDQRLDLLSSLGAELQGMSPSDREYGAAETTLVSAISPERLRPEDAPVLLPALRSYIVGHLSARRCTDNMPAAGKLAKSAEQFNSMVRKLDPGESRYKTISAEEAKAAGDNGTYQRTLFGQSAQSQEITEAVRWLTHGNRVHNGQVLRWTLAERSRQDWLVHYGDAAKLVHDLEESDEKSPEAFFCMKADSLNALATLAPPGTTRDKAMGEYREFLEAYYSSIENPNPWFTMVRHMLYTARFAEGPTDRVWILEQLARSSNPIIVLYAKLEAALGPPKETYPPEHVRAAHK